MSKSIAPCVATCLALTAAPLALAEEQAAQPVPAEHVKWSFSVSTYLWVPAQDGTVGVRGRKADVDMSVGDMFDAIFDNFNGAAIAHVEGKYDRLSLFIDAMYISLENEVTIQGPVEQRGGDVKLDQGIFELGAAFAVLERDAIGESKAYFTLEPIFGARLYYLDLEIDPDNFDTRSGDEFWGDGFIGLRGRLAFNETLALVARGDIGAGGSEFAWNTLGGLEVSIARWFSLTAGYKALGVDYSDDGVTYDMIQHGPFFAMTFRF